MKMLLYPGLIISGLTIVACSNHDTAKQNRESTGVVAMESAKELFEARCAACHGNDGTGGMSNVPDLQRSGSDSATIFQTIKDGRGNMPSFKTMITENEIKRLAEYVYQLKQIKR